METPDFAFVWGWHHVALEMIDDIFEKLNDPDFVGELVRLSSVSEIKKFLIESDKGLDDEDAEKLSSEIFGIISVLKKMDEEQLEKVAGGSIFGLPIPTDVPGAACFAATGVIGAAEGIKQVDTAKKVHDAATKSLAMQEEINRRRKIGRHAVIGATHTKFDTINNLAIATMASLGAFALLKILRRGKKKES